MKKLTILAFGAHSDDIEMLCGGTLAKYNILGHSIKIVVVTNSGVGHPTLQKDELIPIRKKEALAASEVIKAELAWLDFDDQFLFDDIETRTIFIDTIRKYRPDIVLSPYPYDYHHDHRMVGDLIFKTIITACLPAVKTEREALDTIPVLYYYDTLNGINFLPEQYVDITKVIDLKIEMLSKHESQLYAMKELLKADVMEIMEINAKYRGQQCNVQYAECFRSADSYLLKRAHKLLP